MRWARFEQNGSPIYGVVEGDEIIPVRGSPFAVWERTSTRLPLSSVKLLVPVVPPTFYAAGLNYALHVREAAEKLGLPVSLPHGGEFVTGALGAGHVVLPAEDIDAAFDFYTGLIGLSHRDSMVVRIPGMPVRKLRFLGCNPRHHTIALTEAPSPQGMRHMMIEVDSIKTFGRSFARAREAGVLKTEIGQHSNDEVLSFYVFCPGGIEFEYGVHGRQVDEASWVTRELTNLSYWGYWPAPASR